MQDSGGILKAIGGTCIMKSPSEWKEREPYCPRLSEFPFSAPAWVDTYPGPIRPESVSENSPLRFPQWLQTSPRHCPELRHYSSPSGRLPEGFPSCRHERIVPKNAKPVQPWP